MVLGLMIIHCCTSLSLAQAMEESPSKIHGDKPIEEIYRQLNLTDDQKRQLQANKQQLQAKMQMARGEMRNYKEALRTELMKPQLAMTKIYVIHGQIKALQAQMEDDKLNSILAVRNILTADQFAKFVNLMHRHKQEHE